MHHLGASSDEADADDSMEDELIPWQSMATPSTAGATQRAVPGKAHAAAGQDPVDSRNSAAARGSGGAATNAGAQGSAETSKARTQGGGAQPRKLSRLAPAADSIQKADDVAVSPGDREMLMARKVHATGSTCSVAASGNPFVSAGRPAHMQVRLDAQELHVWSGPLILMYQRKEGLGMASYFVVGHQ